MKGRAFERMNTSGISISRGISELCRGLGEGSGCKQADIGSLHPPRSV